MTFGVAAEAHRRLGHVEEADRLCRDGVARARTAGLPWAEAAALAAGADVDALLGAIDGLARLGHLPELLRALDALAIVLGADDDIEPAEPARLLGATASARARLGWKVFPSDAPRLDHTISRARAALGNDLFAAEFERGGTQSLEDVIRRARGTRGPRRRPASGWESLTPAELRVAELAAAGLHNAEIAAKLFVSPGTVKVHLAHVFAKLAVRSRTELSAAYARHRGK